VGTPALFNYQVEAGESDAVVQAFELMEHWPGVNPQHIGIITFSVGSLSVYEAAADPRIRDKVAFLAILGGYADVTSLLRVVGARSQIVNGQAQRWEPITTTAYVLYRSVSYLFSPADQKLFEEAFPFTVNFPPPLPAAKVAQFSPVAAAYYHLLEGDQPGNVDRNLAALSPPLKALLTRLSPLSVISQVHAPIHLLHDRNDPAIPCSQDLEMAAALARLHHPYDLTAYSIFSHVEINLNSTLSQMVGDGSRLLGVLTAIMQVGS
jgi:dienelactone hydrolase